MIQTAPIAPHPILIAGGGIAGLYMAMMLNNRGWPVTVIEARPLTINAEAASDSRTIALMDDAIDLLQSWGLWPFVKSHCAPLKELWLEDDSKGWPQRSGFSANEVHHEAFGWNVPALALHEVLLAGIRNRPGITLIDRTIIQETHHDYRHISVTLNDGCALTAQLLIAMDGANSPLRQHAGIAPHPFGVAQMAMVTRIGHDAPHHNISTEFYGRGHQITQIPLPDEDGRPASALNIVGPESWIGGFDPDDQSGFLSRLFTLTRGYMGTIRTCTAPRLYPVRPHYVHEWFHGRMILAAEAAHVMPPIGAQGLNISIGDARCLAELLGDYDPTKDPGHGRICRAYQYSRRLALAPRIAATAILSNIVHGGAPGSHTIRRIGMRIASDVGPVRRGLIRFGMTATGKTHHF